MEKRLKLVGWQGFAGMVVGTLDMALRDALARAMDVPVAVLLGGKGFAQKLRGGRRGLAIIVFCCALVVFDAGEFVQGVSGQYCSARLLLSGKSETAR